MKKLVINGLLLLVFAVIVFAVIFNIYRLFSVSMIEEQAVASLETEESLTEEKAIVEETAVKVSVTNITNTSDEDVSEFLSSLG